MEETANLSLVHKDFSSGLFHVFIFYPLMQERPHRLISTKTVYYCIPASCLITSDFRPSIIWAGAAIESAADVLF